ncbi:hypothetical protein ASD01_21540 [Ensifer sp. Root423]|nr:hypothetical protein ASD01_21540 [Ensifer sp. Root423]
MSSKLNSTKRVICIGHAPYFGLHMPTGDERTEVEIVDFYHGDDSAVFNCIERFKPDAMLAFRPELIPPSVLLSFSGPKIGFSSEIFPKIIENRIIGDKTHYDKQSFFLGTTTRYFDYMFHYDVASKSYLEGIGVFMSDFPPYPLSDQLFVEESAVRDIDILFIGRISERRARLLDRIKKLRCRAVVIDHGLYGRDIINLLKRSKVVLNLHAEDHISFEPRVLIGAAAGAQVVTEAIHTPTWLVDDPFLRIDAKQDEWVEATMECVASFSHHLQSERRRRFAADLAQKCSANKFLNGYLDQIADGSLPKFRVATVGDEAGQNR